MSCLTEYNEAETMKQLKEEAWEEALEESAKKMAAYLMSKDASLSAEDALKEATRIVTE